MSSGRTIEDMGKFELKALQKSIGLGSIEDTRKFLRGDLKIDEKGSMKAIEAKDPTAIKSRKLGQTLDVMIEGINKTRTPVERFAISSSDLALSATESVLLMSKGMKILKDSGLTLGQSIQAYAADKAGLVERGQDGALIRDRDNVIGVKAKESKLLKTLERALEASKAKGDAGIMEVLKRAGIATAGTFGATNAVAGVVAQGLYTRAEDFFTGKKELTVNIVNKTKGTVKIAGDAPQTGG